VLLKLKEAKKYDCYGPGIKVWKVVKINIVDCDQVNKLHYLFQMVRLGFKVFLDNDLKS